MRECAHTSSGLDLGVLRDTPLKPTVAIWNEAFVLANERPAELRSHKRHGNPIQALLFRELGLIRQIIVMKLYTRNDRSAIVLESSFHATPMHATTASPVLFEGALSMEFYIAIGARYNVTTVRRSFLAHGSCLALLSRSSLLGL